MTFSVGKILKIGLFKYYLIFFYLTLTFQSAISQINTDSLKRLIPGLQGRQKLEVLSELAYYYSFSSNNDYYSFSQEGFEYALSYGDSTYISKFLIELGYYYRLNGSYQESLNKFKRAINISILINDFVTLSAAYTGTGSVFFQFTVKMPKL